VATEDIPLVGGPGDGQTLTVEVDEYGMPPPHTTAFTLEDDGGPRVEGTYELEPVAGMGPPWLYVWTNR
jgi:hypothetical protein